MKFSTDYIDPILLLESMTESVLVTSTDLEAPGPIILYVNQAFEKMTGWRRDEVIGNSPRLLQGPDTDPVIFEHFRKKLLGGEVWSGRTINYKKDGSEFDMEWSISPIYNAKGEIYQYLAVQKDVTEIVRMERNLQHAREVDKRRLEEIRKKNKELSQLLTKQKETLDLFTKYVPEAVVKKALQSSKDHQMVSAKLDVALLFCDIRGFTQLIDGFAPLEVVQLLNIYYSQMSEVINDYYGVINQFVGDEIFVAFGAPKPIDLPELSAVKCAISMMEKLVTINSRLADLLQKETHLNVGIGINFGSVIAGNLGSDDRLSYAVTGGAVVVAKRIESLTKSSPNSILVSQSIYDKTNDLIKYNTWGTVQLQSHNRKINVYEVVRS